MSAQKIKTDSLHMTLTDTGPLVALIDADDLHHAKASAALHRLPQVPHLTTWPCWTETMYLLGRSAGYTAQEELWDYLAEGLVYLYLPVVDEWPRMRDLMANYWDAPMDLADASIVAAAETLSFERVFTFDSHFYAYRLADGSALEVVP